MNDRAQKIYVWLLRGRIAAVGCSFVEAGSMGGENYCGNQVPGDPKCTRRVNDIVAD